MKRILLVAIMAAAPATAQDADDGKLPSAAACGAVLDRVQLALAQADRALQTENPADVERWSAIAANYAEVHASFCGGSAAE